MKKYYYHGTDSRNIESILTDGLRAGCDGVVYMTAHKTEPLKFMMFRPDVERITVLRINTTGLKIAETFDHSEEFFKCKAYGYAGTIDPDRIEICEMYIRR